MPVAEFVDEQRMTPPVGERPSRKRTPGPRARSRAPVTRILRPDVRQLLEIGPTIRFRLDPRFHRGMPAAQTAAYSARCLLQGGRFRPPPSVVTRPRTEGRPSFQRRRWKRCARTGVSPRQQGKIEIGRHPAAPKERSSALSPFSTACSYEHVCGMWVAGQGPCTGR